MSTTQARRQSRPIADDIEDSDELYDTRIPSSARRYRTAPPLHADTLDEIPLHSGKLIQRRRSSQNIQRTNGMSSNAVTSSQTEALTTPGPRRSRMSSILVGMVIMVLLVMGASAFLSWWQVYQDDQHYGRPRTFQMDAVVGHSDSPSNPTHFIFINLNRHVQIIEIPGGDASKMRVFLGPTLFGDGQDLAPVTGEIRVENGKANLIVHIQNQQIVFINDGTTFHPQ